MYNDDDLQDGRSAVLAAHRESMPFLRVYQKEEETTRRIHAMYLRPRLRRGAEEEEDPELVSQIEQAIDMIRASRVRGFFKTVKGFHKGILDLSGRHADRYLEIEGRWGLYHSAFIEMSALALREPEVQSKGTLSIENSRAWATFRETWKVPSVLDYDNLLYWTEKTCEAIDKYSEPKIQQLCLCDLPSEILDRVFSLASSFDITRRLSSTCRLLNEIGRRRLVGARKIILRKSMTFYLDWRASNLPPQEYVAKTAFAARADTLEFCEFLESRPDLLNEMETLSFHDQWIALGHNDLLNEHPVSELDNGEFHQPVLLSVSKIMKSSVNLTSLSLSKIKLPCQLISDICHLPKLDHLELRFCTISKKAQRTLNVDSEGALSSTVRDLEIMTDNDRTCWYATLFCPNLYHLSVRAPGNDALFPPSEAVQLGCRFFRTLKYMYLGPLASFHVPIFTQWLQLASNGRTLPLTHLKIEMSLGISDADIIELLQATGSVKLETLSIDGALQANPALFQWINGQFPNLLGLSIDRRDSTRQTRSKLTTWPVPTWQYAQCLAAFIRLEHFGWNNDNYDGMFTTYSLRYVEEGWLDDSDDVGWQEANDNEYISEELEDHWAPRLFGIYCPSLNTFCFSWECFCILRLSEGVVTSKKLHSKSEISRKWDPSTLGGKWLLGLPVPRVDD